MPIYEYVCKQCDNEFEELVIGKEDAALCPGCGSEETRKRMSSCRVRFGAGSADLGQAGSPASSGSGCGGCAGGSCVSCG